MDELQQDMALLVGDTEKGRQLADDDVDRDAGQESRGDRNRKQGGQPAGAEQADGDEDNTDHEGEQRGQLAIRHRAGDGHRGQRAGEDRRDGRIRLDRHEPVGAEGGEGERSRGKGIEPRLGRHSCQPGGGELARDGNRRQHEPGHQIAWQPSHPVATQRGEEPVGHGGAAIRRVAGRA